MSYTFIPKEKHAKAYGNNLRISKKSARIVCNAIKRKPLIRGKRLLIDLQAKRRHLDGKYYSKAVDEILQLLESCEKNADNLNLEKGKLFIHASAHMGTIMRRRRRRSKFGSRLKTAHIEIMLIERGKEKKAKIMKKGEKKELKTETVAKDAGKIAKQIEKDVERSLEKENKEKTKKTSEVAKETK